MGAGVAVSRVVIMIEDDDGTRHWWEVFKVRTLKSQISGIGPDGTEATITITGPFFRRSSGESLMDPETRGEQDDRRTLESPQDRLGP